MELTNKQKAIQERRQSVFSAYNNRDEMAVSTLVKALANKFKVTEVQIYNDIKAMKKIA
jgi:hypothetical protein